MEIHHAAISFANLKHLLTSLEGQQHLLNTFKDKHIMYIIVLIYIDIYPPRSNPLGNNPYPKGDIPPLRVIKAPSLWYGDIALSIRDMIPVDPLNIHPIRDINNDTGR